jgi:hypothetical protein
MIECSMCGHSFTAEEGAACRSGCPVAGCGMVTCPSCAFEFPPASKLVTFVTNLVRRRLQPAEAPVPRSRAVGESHR